MTTTNPWSRLPSPFYTALDSAGVTLPGALLYFYSSGTVTPLATYSDGNLATPNTNPVVADAGGRFGSIFLQSAEYKVVLKNSAGVEQWTADPVSAFSFGGNRVIGSVETIALARALATVGAGMLTGDLLFINGHLATGDGGNRTMRWVSTSSATDNSATVLKPTDVSGNGRWLLVGDKNPYIFGAVGNGSTDDGAALQAYFTDGINGAFDFGHRGVFLSNQALTCQALRCNWRGARIKFGISNHTDNCLTLVAVSNANEETSRFYHSDLVIDADGKGLDAVYIAHGSPIINNLIIFNSYRDALHLHPDAALSQWIENFTVTNLVTQECGRHALHIYMKSNGVLGTFCNETFIRGFEIRGLGRRFTDSNAIRFTYDGIVIASQTKIGGFDLFDCSWDCSQGGSLAGAGIGDIIYHDTSLGGSTLTGGVEAFYAWRCFAESTDTVVAGKKILNSSYTMDSTSWGLCTIRMGTYQWGSAVPNGYLANLSNNFKQNLTTGGLNLEALGSRPSGFLLYGDGLASNTLGYMDAATIKNAPAVWQDQKDMVASANITFVVPIRPLSQYPGFGIDWAETAVEISLQNWARVTDETYRYRTTWEVTPCITAASAVYCYNETVHSQAPADLTRGFTAANVTFTITSSSGSLYDQITVTVPGGANVGAAGLVKRVVCIARRKSCVFEPYDQTLKGITAI